MTAPCSYRIGRATSPAKASGFTFLEVLIALCIVLIALAPLLQLHITSIRMIDASSRMARATLLANAKLAEIVSMDAPDTGRSDGRVEEERGLMFLWRSTVTQADPAELAGMAVLGVRRVHVDVTWQEGTVSVDTFVRIPVQKEQKDTGDQHDRDEEKTITGRSRT